MPTQAEIAEHLFVSVPRISQWFSEAGIENWRELSMDEIRRLRLEHLAEQAAARKSSSGADLVDERIKTERVVRDLKLLELAQKRGELVPIDEVRPGVEAVMVALRRELLSIERRVAAELLSAHGVELPRGAIDEPVREALDRHSRPNFGEAEPVDAHAA